MFTTNKIHPGAFGRIGDRYSKFIDPYHFMGRNALDDSWMAKPKPRANLFKHEDEYQIKVAVPGFTKNEINIDLEGNLLTVECKKEDLGNNYPEAIRKEYGYNQISRRFVLPDNVKTEEVHTSCQNGVLTIVVPFEKDEVRTIKVSS